MNNTEQYVGKPLVEVEKKLKESGTPYRILRKDKECFAVTMDLRMGRMNLSVDNGIVTSIKIG